MRGNINWENLENNEFSERSEPSIETFVSRVKLCLLTTWSTGNILFTKLCEWRSSFTCQQTRGASHDIGDVVILAMLVFWEEYKVKKGVGECAVELFKETIIKVTLIKSTVTQQGLLVRQESRALLDCPLSLRAFSSFFILPHFHAIKIKKYKLCAFQYQLSWIRLILTFFLFFLQMVRTPFYSSNAHCIFSQTGKMFGFSISMNGNNSIEYNENTVFNKCYSRSRK